MKMNFVEETSNAFGSTVSQFGFARILYCLELTASRTGSRSTTGAGFFLLFTILGPAGGAMSQLAAGPFSPPAERLLAVLLGIAPLALAGVFPFHRAPWRGSLSPERGREKLQRERSNHGNDR